MYIDDIALTLQPQIGPHTAAHLLSVFGSATNIFAASQAELVEKAEFNTQIASRLVKKEYHRQAENEIQYCNSNGITPIVSTCELYPKLLRECNDYPHVLYYKGDIAALGGQMLSVVGTRRMSSYGQKVCDRLVGELAAMFPELVIVSGLAFGVDSACHRAAMGNGLRTIAVIANQLPNIYPSQHTMLATEMIKQGGGVMTEYHSQFKNKGVTYIPRNRIIAGMSAGTIIIESAVKGGSMITAGMAEGYNRSVMAVPGRIGEAASEGTNYLVKNNRAVMICSAEDIARELMWDTPGATREKEYDTSALSKDAVGLLCCIKQGEVISIDELGEIAGLSIPELSALILELEFDGAIRRLPGKMYEKA